jgi:oligopeptidase B
MSPNFSSTRLSLIDRDIIWATAHIRGGMEKGMKWWKEGKLTNKKNTFEDYIYAAKYLIDQKYSAKGKIIGMGGSAGGLLNGSCCKSSPRVISGHYNGCAICRFFNNKSRSFITFDHWRI